MDSEPHYRTAGLFQGEQYLVAAFTRFAFKNLYNDLQPITSLRFIESFHEVAQIKHLTQCLDQKA